ncbi:MAG: adenylate/guanylate cyclase domain-containing protein, partial [Methylibium sp.]|nr:adenylate/guanylate cyclase domain-containing protein [Methylibium sp.]
MVEQQQLQAAIAALEAQRGALGDVVVDTALAPLRTKINALQGELNQQLKQVTVLFADIVGSTKLSQHLDPEEVHAIMDGALQQFTARVQAQGGRVLNYAGDSLLAVFGADEAREDDAESAVRAGLSVLEEGRAQGEQVRLRHGHEGFNVRVGIHTGPVLLGGGVDAEGSIRGMTVNIAARMEQSAPVGALRVSQATWRQVAGAFEGEAQPPLEVKGSDEPLLTWIVRRARPLAERERARGVEGLHTPLVGRDAELAELERLLAEAAPERGPQAVTVIADAGLGKTRLLTEWRARLLARAPGTPLLVGRAHPQ